MARNRLLNPDFWFDEEVCSISFEARLLYMGLWGICDDNYATFPNKPKWVKSQIFPYDNVDTTILLRELSDIKKIIPFTENGEEYFWIKNFFKHQYVQHPSRPKYPAYNKTLTYSSHTPHSELKELININNIKEKNLDKNLKLIKSKIHKKLI